MAISPGQDPTTITVPVSAALLPRANGLNYNDQMETVMRLYLIVTGYIVH